MEDYDIASEVYSQPDVYGLTYAAHRVLFFDFKAAGIIKICFSCLKWSKLTEPKLKPRQLEVDIKIFNFDSIEVDISFWKFLINSETNMLIFMLEDTVWYRSYFLYKQIYE